MTSVTQSSGEVSALSGRLMWAILALVLLADVVD